MLKTDITVDPKRRYKIVVVDYNKEYERNWSKEFKGSELDDTLRTLMISISSKSYEIIEEFCKNNHISIKDFLRNLIENVAKLIQMQYPRH